MTAAVQPVPAPDLDADEALIAAAQRGDTAAFTRLFRRHVDRVRTHLTRLIGPVSERDDLIQQIFLALHRALPTYRGDGALSTFLHRITVNAAYDHLRVRRRRRDEIDTDAVDPLVAPGLHPQARAEARADLIRLFELLGQLSAKKRIAFVLVAVEGMSLAEAAALVGANQDAVKQRVLHARREITALLEQDARREGRHD